MYGGIEGWIYGFETPDQEIAVNSLIINTPPIGKEDSSAAMKGAVKNRRGQISPRMRKEEIICIRQSYRIIFEIPHALLPDIKKIQLPNAGNL